jgi:hypothetical protein
LQLFYSQFISPFPILIIVGILTDSFFFDWQRYPRAVKRKIQALKGFARNLPLPLRPERI